MFTFSVEGTHLFKGRDTGMENRSDLVSQSGKTVQNCVGIILARADDIQDYNLSIEMGKIYRMTWKI